MFCNVCSRDVNSNLFETIGNQFVCSLACVGQLESNEEDECNECHRPVWKDNYYVIDSKNYCSERCKLIAVKKYLKKNSKIKNVNIKHIQNENFRNDTPTKNLKELRKEVKQLYKELENDNSSKKSNQNSEKKFDEETKSKDLNDIQTLKSTFDVVESNQNSINYINNNSNNYMRNNNNQIFNMKLSNKCHMIPNKKPKLKSDINIFKNFKMYKSPSSLSRKGIIKCNKRCRTNYSFDNQNKYFYDNDNDNNFNYNPPLKYSSIKNNHNISNNNISFKKKLKLKPTILRYQNKKQRLRTIRIPSPNMPNSNERIYDNYKIMDSLENNENINYDNIQYQTQNNNNKIYSPINTNFFNQNKICENCHLPKNDFKEDDRIVYLCDTKYKYIDGSNF